MRLNMLQSDLMNDIGGRASLSAVICRVFSGGGYTDVLIALALWSGPKADHFRSHLSAHNISSCCSSSY